MILLFTSFEFPYYHFQKQKIHKGDNPQYIEENKRKRSELIWKLPM